MSKGWNTKPKIVIPAYLLLICNAIQQKLPGKEFSILVKVAEVKPYTVILSEDFVIPKQEVTGSTVDYDPDDWAERLEEGYNAAIHSHHDMDIGFSGTDKNILHSHGKLIASVLYAKQKFKEGVVIANTDLFGTAQIEAEVQVIYPEVDISNITEKQPQITYTQGTTKPAAQQTVRDFYEVKEAYYEVEKICNGCGLVMFCDEEDKICPYCGSSLREMTEKDYEEFYGRFYY